MFELAKMQDTVRIVPADFGKPQLQAITDWIEDKYPGRVIPKLGLCIALYDLLHVGESHILPGSGSQHTAVEFRLVVFRPFVGEVMTGTVVSCDASGARISLGFFDNVVLPCGQMQENTTWSPEEKLWVWNVTPDDPLFLDLENQVRVRVTEVKFAPPSNMASAKQAALVLAAAEYRADAARQAAREKAAAKAGLQVGARRAIAKPAEMPPPPAAQEPAMQVIVSVAESGLGLTSWWPPDEPEGEAEGEAGEGDAEMAGAAAAEAAS